jgi:MOSC domain-containing protein YiiM
VSFVASESIEESKKRGCGVTFGDFAENIATSGVNWQKVPVGSLIQLGDSAIVEITQIGKECHSKQSELSLRDV